MMPEIDKDILVYQYGYNNKVRFIVSARLQAQEKYYYLELYNGETMPINNLLKWKYIDEDGVKRFKL
ncbi:MAG: hypothetical protein HC917_10585 [Richelia sp. SM2_1_7]|nr:hypothetical protein [Richelia sp. SM2_1_7]